MQSERVIQQADGRFRVQLGDGSLLRGVFHHRQQADEHRLQRVAARVLNVLEPGRVNSMPGRASAHLLQSPDFAGDNERAIRSIQRQRAG